MNSRNQIASLLSGEASASIRKPTDKGKDNLEIKTFSAKEVKITREQETKKSRSKEHKSTREKEVNTSRVQESKSYKPSHGQPRKMSQEPPASVETTKNSRVVESDGIRRAPANITLREEYRIALNVLAAKRCIKPWMLLDEAIRRYLADEDYYSTNI